MGNTDLVDSISANLGGFLRHLLPGVVVVGAAYVAYPSRFQWLDANSWQHVVVISIVVLTIGNVWFVATRYIVHQLVDYGMYLLCIGGPRPSESWFRFHSDLAHYVRRSLFAKIPGLARQHIIFRSSSVLLLYVAAEVLLVCRWCHESDTIFARHPCATVGAAILIFAGGVWQHAITRHIDSSMVENYRMK
jgi:hypothetical protein